MASLTFADFVKTTHLALATSGGTSQGEYVAYFCCLLIEGKYYQKIDSAPLRICQLSDNDRAKYYRGDRKITKEDARYINRYWTDKYLYEAILNAKSEERYRMFAAFGQLGIKFEEDDKDEDIALMITDSLKEVIQNIAEGRNERTVSTSSFSIDDLHEECSYNREKGILRVGSRIVKIDPLIAPEDVDPSEEERAYIKALLEVFSALIGKDIDSIVELRCGNTNYYKELINNRECFYSAESIRHVIRDAFSDGEEYFTKYKDELYEGVIVVHHMKYSDGYDRLQAVLDKSTSMNLNCQKLERLYIIGAKEKKGICHMLVDEGKITSWIKRF